MITYASNPDNLPEEFKDLPLEIDDSIDIPLTARTKTHTDPRENFYLAKKLMKSYRKMRRFKIHR